MGETLTLITKEIEHGAPDRFFTVCIGHPNGPIDAFFLLPILRIDGNYYVQQTLAGHGKEINLVTVR